MSKIYQYSYLGSCDSRTVTDSEVSVNTTTYNLYDSCCGDHNDDYTTKTYGFTLDSSAPVDITVWFSYRQTYDDPWTHTENNYEESVTIPAGQTYVEYTFTYWYTEVYANMCPGGGCAREVMQTYDFLLMDQPTIPDECNAVGCNLGFTGITTTAPTQRGENDGTIYAGVTGQTGTTIQWYLNGALQTGTSTTHTFTGLTSGSYIIRATENECFEQYTAVVSQGEFRTGDFVVTSPITATSAVKAVENPIILQLRTATNSGTPAYSLNTFTIDGTISGVSIVFNLTFPYVYTATFLSKGYPDRSTYFLESTLTNSTGTPVGSNSTTEIATSLAEAFQKDAILNRLYYITSSGTTITLKAKEYSDRYDLSSANVTITGSNVTLTNVVPGVAQFDGQIVSDYSLYTEIFVDEGLEYGGTPVATDYYRVMELELPFSKDNVHQFDLKSTLKNFVSTPIYDIEFTGITYLQDYMTSFFCKYGEKYPLIENTTTKKKRYKGLTDYGWVCNAALNFEDDNEMTAYFPPTGYTVISGITFLNTAPSTKYSHRDGDEILYFVIPQNYQYPMAVYGNITLYDGSVYNDIKFLDIKTGTTNNGGVYGIGVGYDTLGLSSYESSSDIRKVDIQVYQTISGNTGYTYTTQQSYLLEIDEQPDTFNVAFLSKLGTYETYSFFGEMVESQEIQRSTYQKGYDISDTGAATPGFEYNSIFETEYTKTFVVNTGIIDEANYNYLLGMLQSNKIFHYDDVHRNYLIPIAQSASKSTNSNEYSLQITFKETISENNVTA